MGGGSGGSDSPPKGTGGEPGVDDGPYVLLLLTEDAFDVSAVSLESDIMRRREAEGQRISFLTEEGAGDISIKR